ncbi:MAG: RNase J family beta-CASP ribonuclease [Candidatus Moranbacteria bacterium]|nr:RNase J family beta-CASP ribonuclease [Candidatus Moranbacteria bacterium]
MNEIRKTDGGGNVSGGNTVGNGAGGNRRRFPHRGGRRPIRTDRPNQGSLPREEGRNPAQGGDILSSGLKDALALGSLEGIVARSQSYRAPHQAPGAKTEEKRHENQPAASGNANRRRQPRPDHKPSTESGQKPANRPAGNPPAKRDAGKPAASGGKKAPRRGARQPISGKIALATTGERNFVTDLPPAEKRLRIIPLGGQEEVGRNMTVFEYGDDIVIIDMGVQWPEEDMPGVDYIVPNVGYLKGKEKNIRGVIFTHGHLDHIGAAPILLKQLGYPPIIGRDLTLALVKHKVEDQEKGAASRLKAIRIGKIEERIRLGKFEARFFEVEHSIMDAIGIALVTPAGTAIHMGDWTIAHEPIDEVEVSYRHLADLPRPTILMLESLGSLKKGLPPSEQEAHRNLKNLLSAAPGRVILATFSSQVRRIGYIVEYAETLGKRVALMGYSMKKNMEIAKELGYIKMKPETLITINDIHKYPDKQVIVICTGAQGEVNAALSRIVTDNDRFVKLQKNDTVVFSSSVIPGNERSIQRLKDNLYRKCDNVIHSDIMDVHISGHSTATGIEEMLRQVQPSIFLPVYANHYFLKEAAKIAYRLGMPDKAVFVLDNGHVFELDEQGTAKVLPKKVDTGYVFIDGLGIGDVGHVVLRDRQVLAADGMVVVTVLIDSKSKEIVGNVQITSRGFIHVKENFDLVNETKRKVQKIVKDNTSKDTSIDWDLIRNQVRDVIGQFLFTKTERRPMILPVVIEV